MQKKAHKLSHLNSESSLDFKKLKQTQHPNDNNSPIKKIIHYVHFSQVGSTHGSFEDEPLQNFDPEPYPAWVGNLRKNFWGSIHYKVLISHHFSNEGDNLGWEEKG